VENKVKFMNIDTRKRALAAIIEGLDYINLHNGQEGYTKSYDQASHILRRLTEHGVEVRSFTHRQLKAIGITKQD